MTIYNEGVGSAAFEHHLSTEDLRGYEYIGNYALFYLTPSDLVTHSGLP